VNPNSIVNDEEYDAPENHEINASKDKDVRVSGLEYLIFMALEPKFRFAW